MPESKVEKELYNTKCMGDVFSLDLRRRDP